MGTELNTHGLTNRLKLLSSSLIDFGDKFFKNFMAKLSHAW